MTPRSPNAGPRGFTPTRLLQPEAIGWAEAGERLRDFVRDHDLDGVVYVSMRPNPQGSGGVLEVTTWRADPDSHEVAMRDEPANAPVGATSQPAAAGIWERLGRESGGEGDRLGAFPGLPQRRSISLPIVAPGARRAVFAVSASADLEDWRERCRLLTPHLRAFGWEFDRTVAALVEGGGHWTVMPSLREIEVLRHAADGHSVGETARLLGVAEETVERRVRDAVRRLGCINETHAVAVAVRRGLI